MKIESKAELWIGLAGLCPVCRNTYDLRREGLRRKGQATPEKDARATVGFCDPAHHAVLLYRARCKRQQKKREADRLHAERMSALEYTDREMVEQMRIARREGV